MGTAAPSPPIVWREEQIQRALDQVVIPKVEFYDATVREALTFLLKRAQAGTPGARPIPSTMRFFPVLPPPDRGHDAPDALTFQELMAAADPDRKQITVLLENISLAEALGYVTRLARLKYRISPHGIEIVPVSDPDPMFTRDFQIPPVVYADGIKDPEAKASLRKDCRQFLVSKGVILKRARPQSSMTRPRA